MRCCWLYCFQATLWAKNCKLQSDNIYSDLRIISGRLHFGSKTWNWSSVRVKRDKKYPE